MKIRYNCFMTAIYRLVVPVLFVAFAVSAGALNADFPLNDDWAYARAVFDFLQSGQLKLSDWASATQLPHILWGALFAKIFGFSHNVLRCANILVSAFCLLVFSRILELLGTEKKTAALFTAVFAFNPLFALLACSFMTDTHYLFWALCAVWAVLKRPGGGENPTQKRVWLFSAFASMAYLTRQLGILIPAAFTLIYRKEIKNRPKILLAAWLLPLLSLAGYWLWFGHVHGPTWASVNYVQSSTLKHVSNPQALAAGMVSRFISTMMESGFFLFPALLPFLFNPKKNFTANKNAESAVYFFSAALLVFPAAALLKGFLPYLENSFGPWGLGTLTLAGAAAKPLGFFGSEIFRFAATAAGTLGAICLVSLAPISLSAKGARFVFAVFLLHFLLSASGMKYFDRYLLPFFAWFLASAALSVKNCHFGRKTAFALILASAALSWTGLSDYFAWNRAKWAIAEKARKHSIKKEEIAAGFDYNAWFSYEKNMEYLKSLKPLKMIGEWEWQADDYGAIVSFGPKNGLETLEVLEYSTPLSAAKGKLFLLKNPGRPGSDK